VQLIKSLTTNEYVRTRTGYYTYIPQLNSMSLSRYESLHDLCQQTFSDFSHLFGHHKPLLTFVSSIPYTAGTAHDMGRRDGTRQFIQTD